MNKIIKYFKILWLLLSFLFIVIFLLKNIEHVFYIYNNIPLLNILLALILIFCAKVLLIFNMFFSLKNVNVTLSYLDCFKIFNTTQIAKYIPGYIWHFVGRIEIYCRHGMDFKKIKLSLLYENIAIVFCSVISGFIFILISDIAFYKELIPFLSPQKISFSLLILAFLLTFIVIKGKITFIKEIVNYIPNFRLFFLHCFVWISLGMSFWFILIPMKSSSFSLSYTIGLYAFAYAIGFITPFAPAGLGVRESILILGLSKTFQPATAIVLSGISRILYIIAEMCLFLISAAMQTKDKKATMMHNSGENSKI